MADEQGVAVVFEDSDDDDDAGDIEMEVRGPRGGDGGGKKRGPAEEEGSDDDDEGEETRRDAENAITGGGMDVDEEEADGQAKDHLDAKEIDAYWIQRAMGKLTEDEEAQETQKRSEEVLAVLQDEGSDDQRVEGRLLLLFNYQKFDFIKVCLRNRWKIVWCTRLARAKPAEREPVTAELQQQPFGYAILDELQKEARKDDKERREFRSVLANVRTERRLRDDKTTNLLELQELSFQQGGLLNSRARCELPPGSYRTQTKATECFFIPGVRREPPAEQSLVPISSLPQWSQVAFKKIQRLNPVQSKVFPCDYATPVWTSGRANVFWPRFALV